VYRSKRVVTALACGFGDSLCGPVVLIDHAAEYLPALHWCRQRHDDHLVMIGGRCCRYWSVAGDESGFRRASQAAQGGQAGPPVSLSKVKMAVGGPA
jgi:hypothetical protein